MITKDGRDLPIGQLTAENYVVPAGEEGAYHCTIELVQFNPRTGVRESHPRVQKFGRKVFEQIVEKTLRKQGYTVTILHDPTEWLKAQRIKAAEAAKKKAELEKEQFNAAVAAEVAKQLAAMKATEKKAEEKKSKKTE